MHGQTDLKEILKNIDPHLVDESFIFMTTDQSLNAISNSLNPIASFLENEGITPLLKERKQVLSFEHIHIREVQFHIQDIHPNPMKICRNPQ